jgi:methyl-accepting chemotaxis protein
LYSDSNADLEAFFLYMDISGWGRLHMVLRKLGIGAKISLGFAIMLGLIIMLGGIAYVSLNSFSKTLASIDAANKRLQLAMQIEGSFVTGVAAARGFIAYGDEKFAKLQDQAMSNTVVLEHQLVDVVDENSRQDVQKLIQLTSKHADGIVNDLAPVVRSYHKQLAAGNAVEAQQLKSEAYAINARITPYSEQIADILTKVVKDNKEIVDEHANSAYISMDRILGITALVALVAIVVGGVLSVLLTRMVCRPIESMLTVANSLADGDLSTPVRQVADGDELSKLAAALNTMQHRFKTTIREILGSAGQVAAASDTLAAVVENSARAASQVDESIAHVASDAETQLAAANDALAVAGQMAAGIQQIAANAGAVVAASQDTAAAAQSGSQTVGKAVTQMENIESTVNSLADVVGKLSGYSHQIGEIVNAISGIASQTNLLALNAAIEAARAGEQGRGFAVVAEEVRRLSEQASLSAKQIAGLIGEIQAETGLAVKAMESGTREVRLGAEVVSSAGGVFTEIATHIDSMSAEIREISAAISEMAGGSQRIVTAVESFSASSKDIASQTQTVASASQEQSASMQEIAASGQGLQQMSQELHASVSKFKL